MLEIGLNSLKDEPSEQQTIIHNIYIYILDAQQYRKSMVRFSSILKCHGPIFFRYKKEKFQYFFVYLSVCLSSIHLYTQCVYVYMYKSIHIIFQSKRERKKTITIVINHRSVDTKEGERKLLWSAKT